MAEVGNYEFSYVCDSRHEPTPGMWDKLGPMAARQHQAGDHIMGLTICHGRTYKYVLKNKCEDGVSRIYSHKAKRLDDVIVRPVKDKIVMIEVARRPNLVMPTLPLHVKVFSALSGEPLCEVCVPDRATVAFTRASITQQLQGEDKITYQTTVKLMFESAGSTLLKNAMCVA